MMVQACSRAGDHRSPLQEKQPIPVILRKEMTKDPARQLKPAVQDIAYLIFRYVLV